MKPGSSAQLLPGSAVYPSSWSAVGASSHASTTCTVVLECTDTYARILMADGSTAWVHFSSLRPL